MLYRMRELADVAGKRIRGKRLPCRERNVAERLAARRKAGEKVAHEKREIPEPVPQPAEGSARDGPWRR